MTESEDDALSAETRLVESLDRWTGIACPCGVRLCGHGVLCSVALGLKNAPRCLVCLARGLGRPVPELREDLAQYTQRRDCYRRAWDVASEREGLPRTARPSCLWPAEETSPGVVDAPEASSDNAGETSSPETWDAGGMACGDLVMALRGRLKKLPPGVVLKVTARDPAAPEDLPAWCRLTGNRLLRAAHPDYFIQRKEV